MNDEPDVELKTAAIYRHDLLPFSETFIREQAEHLQCYRAIYTGLRRVEGLELPPDRVFVVDDGSLTGRISRSLFLASGTSRHLVDVLREHRARIIHAHFEGGGIAAMGLAATLDVPLLVTCHGFDVTTRDDIRWRNPLLRRAYQHRRRQLQRSGRLFLAVSEHIRQKMIERGYPADRIRTHYIGVDVDRLRPDEHIERQRVVLFVGRLVEKKGCEYLIRAMADVQRHVPGTRLVIVGDGPLKTQLQQLSNDVGASGEFVGVQTVEGVRRWMNEARVLCVPTVEASDGDMDGCSMVFPEAHAMGLPVASFASGGTPEAVLHGRTGLLTKEKDWRELGSSIVKLLLETDMWQSFSEAGRLHAEERFNLSRQTRLLEGLYDEICAEAYSK